VGLINCTLHCGVWDGLFFWFGLFSSCVLCVGRGFVPHSQHGCYVGECGCECEGMLPMHVASQVRATFLKGLIPDAFILCLCCLQIDLKTFQNAPERLGNAGF